MKREEEILNKAIDYLEIEENFLEYDDCGDVCDDKFFIERAFIEGAKYADKTMLDRVCEWLNKVFFQNPFLTKKGIVSGKYDTMEEFITAFRQAMKGE
jgi:hypothetical protein